MNHWSNLSHLEKYKTLKQRNKYNYEIKLNHTTKNLRIINYLNRTNSNLCKFAEESYSSLF